MVLPPACRVCPEPNVAATVRPETFRVAPPAILIRDELAIEPLLLKAMVPAAMAVPAVLAGLPVLVVPAARLLAVNN